MPISPINQNKTYLSIRINENELNFQRLLDRYNKKEIGNMISGYILGTRKILPVRCSTRTKFKKQSVRVAISNEALKYIPNDVPPSTYIRNMVNDIYAPALERPRMHSSVDAPKQTPEDIIPAIIYTEKSDMSKVPEPKISNPNNMPESEDILKTEPKPQSDTKLQTCSAVPVMEMDMTAVDEPEESETDDIFSAFLNL